MRMKHKKKYQKKIKNIYIYQMPKSNTFNLDSQKTMKNIMKKKMPAPATSSQGKMEQDIMKYLVKEHKKEALAEAIPKISSKSRKKTQLKKPSLPGGNKTLPKTLLSNKQKIEENTNKGIVKEDLIAKILKYQRNKRFGPIVNKELGFKYSRAQLSKYTIDNLQTILHRIRTHLNTRNMDQVFEHMAKVTAKGYEDLVSGFGYNIEGFSELLLQNPSFHDAFERWKIEREIPDVPPSFQLMYIIASTTYIAHTSNSQIISTREIKQQPPKALSKKTLEKKQTSEKEPRLKSNFKPGDIIV